MSASNKSKINYLSAVASPQEAWDRHIAALKAHVPMPEDELDSVSDRHLEVALASIYQRKVCCWLFMAGTAAGAVATWWLDIPNGPTTMAMMGVSVGMMVPGPVRAKAEARVIARNLDSKVAKAYGDLTPKMQADLSALFERSPQIAHIAADWVRSSGVPLRRPEYRLLMQSPLHLDRIDGENRMNRAMSSVQGLIGAAEV